MEKLSERMLAKAASPMKTWSAGDVVAADSLEFYADEVAQLEQRIEELERQRTYLVQWISMDRSMDVGVVMDKMRAGIEVQDSRRAQALAQQEEA